MKAIYKSVCTVVCAILLLPILFVSVLAVKVIQKSLFM
jgi:hypothetical protein